MTDTNGPSTPGDAPTQGPRAGDLTGTLAELEHKLRELERELTSIGRRRELSSASAAPQDAPPAPEQAGGRLVDEALEPPAPLTPAATPQEAPPSPAAPPPASGPPATPSPPAVPPVPLAVPPAPTAPVSPLAAAEPAQAAPQPTQATPPTGQPVKFVRPLESARTQPREPERAGERPAGGEPADGLGIPAQRPPAEQERPRPSDAQLASLAELRRFRDRLERFARDLAEEYDALLSRVMAGLTAAPAVPVAPASAGPAGLRPTAATGAPVPAAAPPPPAPPGEETLFEGRVELGVGPFYDLASLSAFERQLAGLPHVSEASVRRFEASHAVVDLRLAAPVALVRELRRTADSDFSVREVAEGRILLTFDDV